MKSTRNRNAGKHPSYDKLNWSEETKKKKLAYDKAYSATEKSKKRRVELNRENRRRGTYGNGDGKDVSHTKDGRMVLENQKTNRARNGQNNKSTKK